MPQTMPKVLVLVGPPCDEGCPYPLTEAERTALILAPGRDVLLPVLWLASDPLLCRLRAKRDDTLRLDFEGHTFIWSDWLAHEYRAARHLIRAWVRYARGYWRDMQRERVGEGYEGR